MYYHKVTRLENKNSNMHKSYQIVKIRYHTNNTLLVFVANEILISEEELKLKR